ncbi:hypothetical protein MCAP1_001389 [Malassezia caprae]|uniref:Elongator complex protein 5 n=1 Tax=Malassezia caprae TaxID=1381934 RepID=A0AAF0E6J8_9BASI|nr:hypothetical protein MCAP1_001389 [Malassezia caprae]
MAASCVAAALLSHGPLAPVSSASANHARMPPSMQLVLLEDTVAQSRATVLREMLLRATERSLTALLICFQHDPNVYYYQSTSNVHKRDYHFASAQYDGSSLVSIERDIRTTLDKSTYRMLISVAQKGPTMLFIDSLDAMFDATQCSVRDAYTFLPRILNLLPRYSRLIVGLDSDPSTPASRLAAALHSPQIWASHDPVHDALPGPPWSHATVWVRVHPPALLQHIHKTYGLLPPSSGPATHRAAYEDAGLADSHTAPTTDSAPDMRFWTVLHNCTRRGPLGLVDPPSSTGWWGATAHPQCLHSADLLDSDVRSSPPVVSWASLQGEARGSVFLEIHASLSNGKKLSELTLCAHDSAKRLRIKSLDTSEAVVPVSESQHSSMVQQLPFNLQETAQQRERRDQVPLPYAYQLQDAPHGASAWRGSTGQTSIFFEPEREDDEDDEDPDDDLDL